MAMTSMSDLLQLPRSERRVLAIALGDGLDDQALGPLPGWKAVADWSVILSISSDGEMF
jgi:hypothetical protein